MQKILDILFTNRYFIYALLVINFFGTIYGFWWYRNQFAATPAYIWPFVPNSPLTVLYFFIVLVLFLQNKRSPFWEGLAYFGLIKHGMWTVAIITLYHLAGDRSPDNILLWTGHLGMALQAVLFWVYYGLPLRFSHAVGISGWYLFNDYLDYVVGIHPYVNTTLVDIAVVRNLAVSYSIVLTIIFLFTAWRRHNRKETLTVERGNT
ncbi:DUF1405 domain-containing protein [Dethiobacter alkaliphilus]|uniref:DUF1405 domain-containing protein n=1 Tax=Dethiobacter alkaliphilus TaxID=427926 RepID=UPI0022280068|nr:DUF1405 domain-containing protein [Dethiobacter alkaliphilus]MCW3490427.1 DUF1405 domain-containing protein [Dethiobacter alkaliphilus]